MLKDPVCGQRIRRDRAYAHIAYEHVTYYLCCPRCQAEFEAAPEQYARPELGEKARAASNRLPDRQHVHR
jgi:YHS domain-containing protein